MSMPASVPSSIASLCRPVTLVLERTTSSLYGPNLEKLWRLTSEVTIRFDKKGKPTVASVKKGKEEQR
jgi:hypothetical protein